MKGGKSKAQSNNADRLSVKKGAASRKTKAAKDPNKPKRPPSAFFVFMEEFREQYKQKHPENKQVSVVGKAGGAKWKSMSDAEKAPYVEQAEKRKVQYEKNLNKYNKKLAEGKNTAEESDNSRSEVNDNDDDDDEANSDEEEDDD